MTEAQKKAVEVQKEIEEACIRHGLNLTIFENGIGFVDPKENKIVMVGSQKGFALHQIIRILPHGAIAHHGHVSVQHAQVRLAEIHGIQIGRAHV